MTLVDSKTRVSLQNVLFASDFSSASDAALSHAMSIARRYDSQIYVAHVIRADLFQMVPPEETTALLENARRHAETEMANLLISGRLRGVPHQVLISQGDLWSVLAESIEKHQIDLVVVGTHGRTGVRKLLLGSAAEQIFRLAPCPVLTVGPQAPSATPPEAEFRRILYATDFTPHSDRAAAYAASLAQEHGARLTLLHVVQDVHDPSARNSATLMDFFKNRLRALLPSSAELWCEPELVVGFGAAAESILRNAEEREEDLVVLGIRRTGTFSGHLPPATAYKVACQAHCPVLTVRG